MRQPDIFFKAHEHTSESYGKRPEERTIEQTIDLGIVVIDKPPGPTSHKVAEIVAKVLGAKKAGHIGTLDPEVSGVLPILLNRSTRAASFLIGQDKEYVGVAQFHKEISPSEIKKIFNQFIGQITQVPPVKSAVARRPRQRQIHSFDILEIDGRRVLFRTRVEAGTYIRKLIDDVGRAAKVGANMVELRRTSVGGITEKSAIPLHSIFDAVWLWKEKKDETFIRRYVKNIEEVITNKKIWISDNAIDPVCSGAPLLVPGVVKCDRLIKEGDPVAMLSLKDEIVAFGTARMHSDEMISARSGIAAETEKVLMEIGTYPTWKKKQR